MRKNIYTLAVALVVSCAVYATGIDRQQAAELARDFMSKSFSKSAARRAAQTVPLHAVETGQSLVYAFNVEGGGYVVVAGDDCAPAILGFSETSEIDPQDIPDGMKYLFEQYQEEMQFMIQNGQRRTGKIDNLGAEVKPLMAAKWGQGSPYNYMCPKFKDKKSNSLQTGLVGCVAVAMAQIMYYHQYPAEVTSIPGYYYNSKMNVTMARPMFSDKTLEWDKMLPTYGTRTDVTGTQQQQDAVAKLMRLVGQSVSMDYSPSSSGAYECAAYSSLINYFNYDAQTMKLVDRFRYSYDEWIRMIYNELATEKRPVYYCGKSSKSGHAFVVDGYKEEDFFYINWGWYGNQDEAFRLQLCDPRKKYEGGGTGAQGYACCQQAIIGIKPASSPQHIDPIPEGYFKWISRETYQRASVNEDFIMKQSVNQWFLNNVHVTQPFGYGFVVKTEDGTVVQEKLPLSDDTKSFTLATGRQKYFNDMTLKLGAGLGDGTYVLEFQYRIGEEGEWHTFNPVFPVMFKISGNTLAFDCRPDWLEANMTATKLDNYEKDSYAVIVNLKNKSTDKTYQRTLVLAIDNVGRFGQDLKVAVMLEPGQEQTFRLLYQPGNYTPKTLYMITFEDGAPLCKAQVDVPESSGEFSLEGTFNLTNDLRQQADKSYVLKTDDTYEVVYQYKNTGEGYFSGYLALVDSVRYEGDDHFEMNELSGELVRLRAGDTGELRLTVSNDDEPNTVHKIDFITYDDNDCPFPMDNGQEFTIRPLYDLSFDNFTVTPTEAVEDEYADRKITGKQATVSGKISNPEETAFSGLVMIKRYVNNLADEPEQDEDGTYYIDCDKVYATDVTIPAKGSIDYAQLFDMEGLVTDKNYSVLVDFEITVIPDKTGEELPLYLSDSYLLNDGTPTGVNVVRLNRQQTDAIYDLQGRRISGKRGKALYIINGKKVILR